MRKKCNYHDQLKSWCCERSKSVIFNRSIL